jgi:hypothetical protein
MVYAMEERSRVIEQLLREIRDRRYLVGDCYGLILC